MAKKNINFKKGNIKLKRRDLNIKNTSVQKLKKMRGTLAKLNNPKASLLFHGPPGTGITLAATVLAGKLEKELQRINLSQEISKFIGETEKNLDLLFRKATNKNLILFFDEADALFGKRTEVKDSHDRYTNQEVSYLLQRIEMYPGICILSVNKKKIKNKAFKKQFNFAIKFKDRG